MRLLAKSYSWLGHVLWVHSTSALLLHAAGLSFKPMFSQWISSFITKGFFVYTYKLFTYNAYSIVKKLRFHSALVLDLK